MILGAIMAPPLVYLILKQTARRGLWGSLSLAVPLFALAVVGGPWVLGTGLVVTVLGWLTAPGEDRLRSPVTAQ